MIVGDLATDNDAALLREAGIPMVEVTTGTVCHLDAEMVSKAAAQLDPDKLDVLVIKNVGNLVCPADYDLGENLRVVLLSTTEGEDKLDFLVEQRETASKSQAVGNGQR